MKDTLNIFTRRAKGQAHQQTCLTVDWEGINDEELRLLARACIIHGLQHFWRQPLQHVPEHCTVKAKDFVKGQLHEPLIEHLPPPKPAAVTMLDKMIAALSQEEREKLFGTLTKEA